MKSSRPAPAGDINPNKPNFKTSQNMSSAIIKHNCYQVLYACGQRFLRVFGQLCGVGPTLYLRGSFAGILRGFRRLDERRFP